MIDNQPLDSISRHVEKLRAVTTKRGFRLAHWRIMIRIAQDEYERELEEWNSLNSVKADPQLETGGLVG